MWLKCYKIGVPTNRNTWGVGGFFFEDVTAVLLSGDSTDLEPIECGLEAGERVEVERDIDILVENGLDLRIWCDLLGGEVDGVGINAEVDGGALEAFG